MAGGYARRNTDAGAWAAIKAIQAIVGAAVGASRATVSCPGDAVDASPAIQAAIDTGATDVYLERSSLGSIFLLNSPIFDDSTSQLNAGGPQQRSITIRSTTNATIKLGTNLPLAANTVDGSGNLVTAAWTGDAASRWAFFPNTLRSAYNATANVVRVATATTVPGIVSQSAPFGRIRFKGLVIDGGNELAYNGAGLAFGNQANIHVEYCTVRYLSYLFTWLGYCDMPLLRHTTVQMIGHGAENPLGAATLIIQFNSGDGLVIDAVECNSASTVIYNGFACKGAHIRACVSSGGFIFSHCEAIVFDAQHMEMTQTGHAFPNIVCKNSKLTIRGCWWSAAVTAGYYFLDVEDSASGLNINDASVVKLEDCVEVFLLNAGTDPVRTAGIRFNSVMLGGSLTVDNHKVALLDPGGVTSFQGGAPLVTSSNSNIANALLSTVGTSRRLSATASSRWTLRTSTGASANPWVVETVPGSGGTRLLPPTSTPTVATPVAISAAGTLTNTQVYEYAAATIGDDGALSAVSAAASLAATATGGLRIGVTVPTSPNGLIVWRKTGTGVLASPDRYIIIPTDSSNTQLIDTGANVNGLPWVTTSIPPTTGYTTNVGARLFDPVTGSSTLLSSLSVVAPSSEAASRWGLIAMTQRPVDAVTASGALTAGQLYVQRVVAESSAASAARNVKFEVAAAGTGITLAKAAVFSLDGATQLGVSADFSADVLAGTTTPRTESVGTFGTVVGTEYWIAFLTVGGGANILRANNSNMVNMNRSTSTLLFALGPASLTDMPATLTPSGFTANSAALWFGLT